MEITTYICNPTDYKTLRNLMNNDLLLRNAYHLETDYYIPRGIVYISTLDEMLELDNLVRSLQKGAAK